MVWSDVVHQVKIPHSPGMLKGMVTCLCALMVGTCACPSPAATAAEVDPTPLDIARSLVEGQWYSTGTLPTSDLKLKASLSRIARFYPRLSFSSKFRWTLEPAGSGYRFTIEEVDRGKVVERQVERYACKDPRWAWKEVWLISEGDGKQHFLRTDLNAAHELARALVLTEQDRGSPVRSLAELEWYGLEELKAMGFLSKATFRRIERAGKGYYRITLTGRWEMDFPVRTQDQYLSDLETPICVHPNGSQGPRPSSRRTRKKVWRG